MSSHSQHAHHKHDENDKFDEAKQLQTIKELDQKIQNGSRRLQEMQEDYLEQLRSSKDKQADYVRLEGTRKTIERMQKELIGQSKEKIYIADSMFQAIDSTIVELETDLERLLEQQQKAQKQAQQEQQQLVKQKSQNLDFSMQKKKSNKKEIKNVDKSKSKQDRHSSSYSNVDNAATGWQTDEPKYCFCDKPYYGNMIGCEDENCEREWFHYECVGITDAPEGSWYCRDCIRKQRRQHQ